MEQATFVTALYDIGREKLEKKFNNHRSFSDYLTWFKTLLNQPFNLVIFVPKSLKEFVTSNRDKKYKTQIVEVEFEQLPYYVMKNTFGSLMKSFENKDHGKIETILPEYNVVTFSKFPFVEKVINEDPFNSKYFFWVDAGHFRFDVNITEIDPYKLKVCDDKVVVSLIETHPKGLGPLNSDKIKEYLSSIPNDINTSFWGGNKEQTLKVSKKYQDMVQRVVGLKAINNDQQILSLVIAEAPELFNLINVKNKHHGYLLSNFCNQNNRFCTNYPICPKIKVFALASREISENSYKYWSDSVKHFGYDYKVLGREDKWAGWSYRTKKYLEESQKALEQGYEYVVLTDISDTFFCASSYELYDKLLDMKYDVTIGGERILFYNDPDELLRYRMERKLDKICKDRYIYPNGGFVAGNIKSVIELLKLNSECKDDQKGYCDIIVRKDLPFDFRVDGTAHFAANVPNYGLVAWIEENIWEWKSGRPTNKLYGTRPVMLHFPGTSKKIHEFYNLTQDNTEENSSIISMVTNVFSSSSSGSSSSSSYWWIAIIVIIVVLIVVLLSIVLYNKKS